MLDKSDAINLITLDDISRLELFDSGTSSRSDVSTSLLSDDESSLLDIFDQRMYETVIDRLAFMSESQHRWSSVVDLPDQNIWMLMKDSCTTFVKYDTLSRKEVVYIERLVS